MGTSWASFCPWALEKFEAINWIGREESPIIAWLPKILGQEEDKRGGLVKAEEQIQRRG